VGKNPLQKSGYSPDGSHTRIQRGSQMQTQIVLLAGSYKTSGFVYEGPIRAVTRARGAIIIGPPKNIWL